VRMFVENSARRKPPRQTHGWSNADRGLTIGEDIPISPDFWRDSNRKWTRVVDFTTTSPVSRVKFVRYVSIRGCRREKAVHVSVQENEY